MPLAHLLLAIITLALAGFPPPAAAANVAWLPRFLRTADAGAEPPPPPPPPPPPECVSFTRVCIDQGTFIFHGDTYDWQSPRYRPVPDIQVDDLEAQTQTAGDSNTDADPRPRQTLKHAFRSRAASALEGTSALQRPAFSNRTVPVVLYGKYMYNVGEFMRYTMAAVHAWHEAGAVDDGVSYVLSTPGGQGLHAFHEATLGAYSRYAVTSLADFSNRAVAGVRVGHTVEGSMQQCFARSLVCRLADARADGIFAVGRRAVARWAAEIPRNPLRFSEAEGVLKVVISTRNGGVRRILNMEELLKHCEGLPRPFGAYDRVECRAHSFAVTQPVSRAEFMRNLGVMQTIDVLVFIHGSEGANSYYGRPGMAMLELRPCGFGTLFPDWVNLYYPTVHRANGDQVLFFGVNVENVRMCEPGEHEWRAQEGPQVMKHTFARDRHLKPAPAGLFEAVKVAASYLGRVDEYREARDRGENVAVWQVANLLLWGAARG